MLLALSNPPRVRQSLALDLYTNLIAFPALLAEEVVVRGIPKQMLGEVACLDTTSLAGGFHPTRKVHGITEEAVAGHLISHHASDDRAGSQSGTDEDLFTAVGAVGLDKVQGVEREEGDPLGGLGGGAAIRSATDDHVGVPDRFHLVHPVLLHELIKSEIQLVEHPHHLQGGHLPGHGGEAHDVREEDGDVVEPLDDGLAPVELPDGRRRHHLVQQVAVPDLLDQDEGDGDGEEEGHADDRGDEAGVPRRAKVVGGISDVHDPLPVGRGDGNDLGAALGQEGGTALRRLGDDDLPIGVDVGFGVVHPIGPGELEQDAVLVEALVDARPFLELGPIEEDLDVAVGRPDFVVDMHLVTR
mmetsp:Transcript_29031/g.84363  ORF Transcript_29031/g.84363 Transcript_29031/m.84363 type:complete len:357 (+) Transcript_29031:959-2029(+)